MLDTLDAKDEKRCVSLLNHRDQYGMTPMHYAVVSESKGVVELFARSRFCSFFDLGVEDDDGESVWQSATAQKNAEIDAILEAFRR